MKNIFKNKRKNILKDLLNKIKKNKNKYTLKETLIFMIITFIFGMLIGGIIMHNGSFLSKKQGRINEFINTYNDIVKNYYQDIDEDELLNKGLSAMLDYLGDPYSTYMSEEETLSFNEEIEGEYCGIGAEIIYEYQTGISKIYNVFKNSPAEKAGLQKDDILKKVDGASLEGKDNIDISKLVKGKKGTTVKITIERNKEEKTFNVKRDVVETPSVISKVYEENNKKVGYLGVTIFAENTDEQFAEKLKELEKENIDSLIIDVRGNSGGFLTTATNIISLFTKKGSIIYQLKTKDNIEIIKDKSQEARNYPICVITNGASASASELLTSALKENYNATIIGTKTYGKGKVQKAYELSDGTSIKYTFQEWLTSLGNSIDGIGIEPTIYVEYEPCNEEIDNQLQKALTEITK